MNDNKSRGKVRAFLAGGLVLGVGAAVTLAAWNDSEFVDGIFAAGSFNLEGSTNGTTYSDNDDAASPGTLDFEVNPENLAPDDVVYAPFAVRLDAATTTDASVVVTTESGTGALTGLTYQLISPTTFGCDATTTGTVLVPAATALGTTPAGVDFDLLQGSSGAAGTPVNLCFKVTATDALPQAQTGSTIWSLTAESQ